MLQALRTKLGSYVVKIFFAFLVGSFAIWGIGDVVRAIVSPDRPAVVAGNQEINSAEIGRAFQTQVSQLRQRFGNKLTNEQAAQLGILDQTVERLVADALYDQEARHLGIEVGMDLIRDQMRREPAFKDSTGNFSPIAFSSALRNANLSEQDFVRMVRQGIDRDMVAGSVEAGASMPKALVNALQRYRGERRVAEMVAILHASVTDVPTPTAEDLAAYHKDHAAQFSSPEYRRASMLRLATDDIAAGIAVDDASIKDEYDRRSSDFLTPEKRDLLQALMSDEEEAKKLSDAAKAGDFATAAKDIAKLDADSLKLGALSKSELPAELGDPVFSAAEGSVTAPVKSALGWHVFKVEKILPATARALADVRDEIKAGLAKDQASDQIARLSVKLEDELVGGGNFNEAAKKLNLKIVAVGPVDRSGNDPDGKPAELTTADRAQLLKTVFETESGKTSALVETDKGDFFVVRTDEVRPEALKPIDQVKDQVTQAWLGEKRIAAAKEKANQLFEKAKAAGNDLPKAVTEAGLSFEVTKAVTRAGTRQEGAPPPQVVTAMFQTKTGDLARASTPDAETVVRVKEILPPDPAESEKQAEAMAAQLRAALAQDLAAAFSQGLRQRYPVRVDRSQIEKLF